MCGTETTTALFHKANGLSNGTKPPTGAGPVPVSPVNLDQGDPTLFGEYWKKAGDRYDVEIKGSELMSYLSDPHSICWFLIKELADSIRRIHRVIGNAETEGRHLVVGNGSTQLIAALLYALSDDDSAQPLSVVCAAPYYSCYQEVADLLQSRRHKWEGDVCTFDKDGPYVEIVTTPNNPDGSIRGSVVNRGDGKVIYDLAYYWPQYTAITQQYDHDIMLFTFSKCTGHAGSRIGWAIVKDEAVAKRMVHYMTVMSIGVCREGQVRAEKILRGICDDYEGIRPQGSNNFIQFSKQILIKRWEMVRKVMMSIGLSREGPIRAAKILSGIYGDYEGISPKSSEKFFEFSKKILIERWEKLRKVVNESDIFSLPKFPKQYCLFSAEFTETYPAFAWLKCKDEFEDCQILLRAHKILVRGGSRFGVDSTYARVSMVSDEDTFNSFIERLSGINNGNIA